MQQNRVPCRRSRLDTARLGTSCWVSDSWHNSDPHRRAASVSYSSTRVAPLGRCNTVATTGFTWPWHNTGNTPTTCIN